MFDSLGLHIPDWVFALAAVAGVAVAYRFLGLRGALATLAAFALLLARTSGQKAGAAQQEMEARRALDKSKTKATRARNTAIRDNSADERLREDDGFRRD